MDTGALQLLIFTEKNKFKGLLTDGDIRRALISGKKLSDVADFLKNSRAKVCFKKTSVEEIEQEMIRWRISHLPLIDKKNNLLGLFVNSLKYNLKNKALFVIMAGGLGTRLKPITNKIPKSLVLYKGKPLIETIITKAKEEGFSKFLCILRHKAKQIKFFLRQKNNFNCDITFVTEKKPLGTIGGLSLFSCNNHRYPFFITNTDVITSASYEKILNYYEHSGADALVVVKEQKIKNQFGEVEITKQRICKLNEKANKTFYISAGIYVLKQELIKKLKMNSNKDMPDFLNDLIKTKKKIVPYFIHENWNDVGTKEQIELLS